MRRSVFVWVLILLTGAASVGRSAEKSDPDDVPLAGVVTQPSDNPAAEADVWLVTASMRGEPLVYDHTRTDAEGNFRVTLPGRWLNNGTTMRQELGLVAFQPGFSPAVVGFSRNYFPKRSGLKLDLRPNVASSIRVVAPDGTPVRGATVTIAAMACDAIRADSLDDEPSLSLAPNVQVQSARDKVNLRLSPDQRAVVKLTPNGAALGRITILLPDDVSRCLQAETDTEGQANLPGAALDDIGQLVIESKEFGTQIAQLQSNFADFSAKPKMPDTIELRPVGRISGKIVADDPKEAAGLPIKVTSVLRTNAEQPLADVAIVGRAETACDAQGRFEIPVIAEGTLEFNDVSKRAASALRLRLPWNKAVKAAERTEIEIPFPRGTLAEGRVIERSSKRPLSGITVQVFHGWADTDEAVTDDDGRFRCLLPPGRAMALPITPSAYAPLARDKLAGLGAMVPDNAESVELPTIELALVRDVAGAVVDEDGKPARGANVRARWEAFDRRLYHLAPRVVELTADDGSFTIEAVNPDEELLLEARTENAFGRVRVPARSLDDNAVRIQVRSADLVALSGRLVTASGKPVGDVPVELWVMQHVPEGHVGSFERVKFDGNVTIRTDGAGRYETPRELDRESVYQVRVSSSGGEPEATPGFSAALADSTELPDLIVRRTTTLAGRVEDRLGEPIAEAVVFQSGDAWKRLQTTTDGEGKFRLPDAMADPTFVYIRKAGFRFFGERIEADDDAVIFTLTKTEEPAEPLTTLPRALPRDERLALARRLLEPCLAKFDLNNEREGLRLFEAWARVDPADLLARLDKTPPKQPFFAGYLRRAAAQALAVEDPDEALALIETIDDTSFRTMSYLDVVDALPEDQRPRKLELLGQAAVVARQTTEPAMRVHQISQTAERLLDLGERGEAEKLLREGETLAQQLPVDAFGGYTRGAFAEELGQIDLPAALKLMKGLTDVSEFDRHHGNLAHELAATQPAEAERLLGMLHPAKEAGRIADPSDLWGVRVCYRMAPVDLPRARAIAVRMSDPYLKARSYGVMAQAIAKQDAKAATELIARAFDVLQTLVDAREATAPGTTGRAAHDWFNGLYSAASVAGALLPAVETVNPTLIREYLWRAVSFRMPRVGDEQQLPLADRANAALAMMVARYDRETAAAILRPIESRLAGFHSRDTTLASLMLIDPRQAVETVEQFDRDQADPLTRAQLATLLTLDGDALWRKLFDMTALWSIDVEDL